MKKPNTKPTGRTRRERSHRVEFLARRAGIWILPLLLLGTVVVSSTSKAYGAQSGRRALILCSMRIHPYEALVKAIENHLGGVDTTTLYLNHDASAQATIQRLEPNMIFTVGREALKTALPVKGKTPLVFTMVLFPQTTGTRAPPACAGVGMIPSPARQLLILKNGFHMKHVCIFYNPKVTGFLARLFTDYPPEGLSVQAFPVGTDGALISALGRDLGGADGILLIPDPSILTEQGLNALIRASYAGNIPIVAFAPMYLQMGAAVSLSVSREETAKTAVSLALAMAGGDETAGKKIHYPQRCEIRVCEKAAKKLALHVDTPNLLKYGDVDWSE